jgi:hypothetical protein
VAEDMVVVLFMLMSSFSFFKDLILIPSYCKVLLENVVYIPE